MSLTNTLRFASLCEVLQSLPGDSCLGSGFPRPFASRSRLFALTTNLPELLMDLQTLYKYEPSFGHLHLGIKTLLG